MVRLKPVKYAVTRDEYKKESRAKQLFLLKALQITQDPKELRRIMGLEKVAEVYKTLDKLAMRKEYHSALLRAGIDFDFIVGGFKDIAITGEKDRDRLSAYMALLKSLGVDRYEIESATHGGSWEEALLRQLEEGKSDDKKDAGQDFLSSGDTSLIPKYDVDVPVVPKSVQDQEEEEKQITKGIYG